MKSAKGILPLVGAIVVVFVLSSVGVFVKAQEQGQVIRVTAKKFVFTPNEIKLKKGVPVVLELTSLDRVHGFKCPDLGLRTDIEPNKVTKVQVLPQKAGAFRFFCDVFCGSGHEEMEGKFVVTE